MLFNEKFKEICMLRFRERNSTLQKKMQSTYEEMNRRGMLGSGATAEKIKDIVSAELDDSSQVILQSAKDAHLLYSPKSEKSEFVAKVLEVLNQRLYELESAKTDSLKIVLGPLATKELFDAIVLTSKIETIKNDILIEIDKYFLEFSPHSSLSPKEHDQHTLAKKSYLITVVSVLVAIFFGLIQLYPEQTKEFIANFRITSTSFVVKSNQTTDDYHETIENSSSPVTVTQQKEEIGLKYLTTGITRSFAESKLGQPIIIENYDKYKVKGLYFNCERFYLTVLIDKNDNIIFYSITSKSKYFRPIIPYLGSNLGNKTFAALGAARHLYSFMSSKYYEYAEVIYLGNPSNYRNIYLAYHSSGVDFSEKEHSYAVLSSQGTAAVTAFRGEARPNTFGVGDMHGFDNEEEILKEIGVGIDYFSARDLH